MGQKKTKEAIAKAASASKKGGKKKWSKGKVKDKLNNKVFMDEATDKAMRKDVTNMSLITISTLSEKYKIIGSLARPLIKHSLLKEKSSQLVTNTVHLLCIQVPDIWLRKPEML